jgi:hypothetical protein
MIASSTLALYSLENPSGANAHSLAYNIYSADFGTGGNLTTADFDAIPNIMNQGGGEPLSNTQPYSLLIASGSHAWPLNSNGLRTIDTSGTTTKFAFLSTADGDNMEPAGSGSSYVTVNMADKAGTTKDPQLVVEHFAALATTTITSNISSNTTWSSSTVYIIAGNIAVDPGVTLTVNPGTIIKFGTQNRLTVDGTLDARGTSADPITFTSYYDDIPGGDSGGDGFTTPQAGDWDSIRTYTTGSTTLQCANISYGGHNPGYYDPGWGGAVANVGGFVTLDHTAVATSSLYGVWSALGSTTIVSADLSSATVGLLITGGAATTTTTALHNADRGVQLSHAQLFVATSTFSDNAVAVLYESSADTSFTHAGNTATGTGLRGIVVSGGIAASETWPADTMPYIISSTYGGSVSIPSGKNLTINPGAVVTLSGS